MWEEGSVHRWLSFLFLLSVVRDALCFYVIREKNKQETNKAFSRRYFLWARPTERMYYRYCYHYCYHYCYSRLIWYP